MTTPIVDFVKKYAQSNALRLHMPGHKGRGDLGFEKLDVTEIDGADSLFDAQGIIAQSERNASGIFGANTFYSTEGSSLSVRAMLYLVKQYAVKRGIKPVIAAGRNAHKSFLSGVALLDLDIVWICPENGASYLSCNIDGTSLEKFLDGQKDKPVAVYITTPDYLGNNVDVKAIADVCKKRDILLLVDNAHGAYLKFLPKSLHPIDLGATMCCDSAHKTLPCLTGGGYLHVSRDAPREFVENAKIAMSLFASTSPSYLILQSLDLLNARLSSAFDKQIESTVTLTETLKNTLLQAGWTVYGNEPLKITLDAKAYGYTGDELAKIFLRDGLVCEFYDTDYLVMMFSTNTTDQEFCKAERIIKSVPKKTGLQSSPPAFKLPERVLSVRDAVMMNGETVSIENSLNRIACQLTTHCPPAVPVIVSGERISHEVIEAFKYYGIKECSVIKE